MKADRTHEEPARRADGVDRVPEAEGGAWSELVERTRSLLAEVARRGATITYAEVRGRLDRDLPHRGAQDLAALLRAVSLAEEEAGRGLVSAVVVGQSGRPGAGWFRLAAELGRDVADPDAAWWAERSRLAAGR